MLPMLWHMMGSLFFSTEHKNPERVAAGLKAAIHNPNVSEEAKERASERLEHMGEKSTTSPDTNRVLGGYKATLSVSAERVVNARL